MLHVCFCSLLPAVTVSAAAAAAPWCSQPARLHAEPGTVCTGAGGKATTRVTSMMCCGQWKKNGSNIKTILHVPCTRPKGSNIEVSHTKGQRPRVWCVCIASSQHTAAKWLFIFWLNSLHLTGIWITQTRLQVSFFFLIFIYGIKSNVNVKLE